MMRQALVLLLVMAVTACGFRPLYSTTGGGEGYQEQLGSIRLASIDGPREASLAVSDALESRLPSENGDEIHSLTIQLSDSRRAVAVRIDSDTQRFDYALNARLVYQDLETKEVRQQSLRSIVSYGIVPSQYASLVGREDAVRRAAIDLSRKIESDMALYAQGRAPSGSTDELLLDNVRDSPLRQLQLESERSGTAP